MPTAVHLCFGYAAVVRHKKPAGYSFLPELADSIAEQISIEAAQPRLDLGVLRNCAGKTIILGVHRPRRPAVETPRGGRRASAPALATFRPSGSSPRPIAA